MKMSDYKIAEIRERHEDDPPQPGAEDVAILLAEVDRQRAEIERLGASILSLAKSLRASLDAAIRQRDEARTEIEKLRAENERAKADAWDEGYQDHRDMIEGIARKPSNPYR
jgi:cell division protein FtsB